MHTPLILAHGINPLWLLLVFTMIGFFFTAFSLDSSPKPQDKQTAKMMFAMMGIAVLLWLGYMIWQDSLRHT